MFELLKEIFKIPYIYENFSLAGGTSLSLQIGHRDSADLDIFSMKTFLPADLESLLTEITKWDYEHISRFQRMLFCRINGVKCDFVIEPSPLINPHEIFEGVKFYSVADIAAMKMHTVCGRGKKKDFFDIYVLIELYGWKEMLKWFEQKYGKTQFFYLWKSITYFIDADEEPDPGSFPPYTKSWDEIKLFISKKCR